MVKIMVKMIPYLNVPNAKDAIDVYQKIFDAKLLNHLPFNKNNPPPNGFPDNFDFENSTIYAQIEILGLPIHLSDSLTDVSSQGMVDIYLELDNEDQINQFYNKAKDSCEVKVPLAKQAWGAYYTNFKDPVGITWQLSCAATVQEPDTKQSKAESKSEKKTSKATNKKSTSKKKSTKKSSKKGK